MATLGDFLADAVERFGERPALLYRPGYRTETWTYAQLWERSSRVLAWLRGLGLERGDRVLIQAPNSPWWVAAYIACMRLGIILAPLDARSGADFSERVVEQTEPRLAILSRLTGPHLAFPCRTALLEDLETLPPCAAELEPGRVADDDIAAVIFTSGTTGDPKGVILTHGNITANVASALRVIPTGPDQRLLSILPLSHMFEQTVGLLLPLARGASIYYPASRQSTMLFRDVQTQGITAILAVPQVFALLMAAIERGVEKAGKRAAWERLTRLATPLPMPARRLLFHRIHRQLGGRLRFLVSGGAPLEPQLVRAWETLGIPLIQGYGATEAAPIISGTTLADRGPGTVGRAVPDVAIRIAEDGEILVRGPNITPGYWRNARATADAFSDGWYRTGDLGQIDAQGRLILRGRKKDMIVTANGQNVYAIDVEDALRATGALLDAVVVGLPGPHGARVHAVLLYGPAAGDPGQTVRAANRRLAPHQQIQDYTVWSEADFPRTHTLKVKKQEVVRLLLAQHEAPLAAPHAPSRPAEDVSPVRSLMARAAGKDAAALRAEDTLGDGCGLDSLARVELLAAIESDLGVYLDESRVGPETTVAQCEALVAARESGARPSFPRWPLRPAIGRVRQGAQWAGIALLDALAPASVSGRESLAGLEAPVLFVANHTSHLDSAVLIRALPDGWRGRLAVAAAADYFFTRRVLGASVALALNAFPFSREGNIRPTIEHCAWLLDSGWSILLFPEGTRSRDGAMAPFKSGAGLLAVELGVPVVPVHLGGVRAVLPKGRRVPRRAAVRVRFGPALRFVRGTPYDEAAAAMERAWASIA